MAEHVEHDPADGVPPQQHCDHEGEADVGVKRCQSFAEHRPPPAQPREVDAEMSEVVAVEGGPHEDHRVGGRREALAHQVGETLVGGARSWPHPGPGPEHRSEKIGF